MIVPAILFALVNLSGPGAHGWGIPMATDIAMALGVLALVGSRVHPSLKLFLLSVAIVDDIGAIVVIAVFYSTAIDPTMLAASVALVGLVVVLNRFGVRHVGIYIVVGTVLWLTTHEAGVHATIAGVILGLLAPTKPFLPVELVVEAVLADVSTLQAAQETVRLARASVSVVEWIEHHLHPWTSLVIVPLFAFANAGITLDGERLRQAVSSRVTLGVIVGLVGGKIIGVTAGTWFAVRARVTTLPEGLTWRAVVGAWPHSLGLASLSRCSSRTSRSIRKNSKAKRRSASSWRRSSPHSSARFSSVESPAASDHATSTRSRRPDRRCRRELGSWVVVDATSSWGVAVRAAPVAGSLRRPTGSEIGRRWRPGEPLRPSWRRASWWGMLSCPPSVGGMP